MREDEARDHERVVSEGVELGVGEREDHGQDGRGDVTEQDGPEWRDAPVRGACVVDDEEVEVAAELVALVKEAGC